jgi:NAD+ synthase (glutamine-hydrolysing)
MPKLLKIALAQINPHVGAIGMNADKIISYIDKAKAQGADLVVFPELAITGYPPEDLVLKPQFITDNLNALKDIAKFTKGIAVYVGFVDRDKEHIYNAGAFINNGKIVEIYHKNNLPNYKVFDEKRYFTPGTKTSVVTLKGTKIGLGICEDIWVDANPYIKEAKAGAKLMLVINASPYHIGKIYEREKVIGKRAKATKAHIIYVNMVGGQDELVFDGGSFAVNSLGKVIASAPQFIENLLIVDSKGHICEKPDELAEIYYAISTGLKDYVDKNGFTDVLIGLSGGIDSALTLTIAVDVLGKNKVHPVYMPSQYSAQQSLDDSKAVTKNLGTSLDIIPIKDIFGDYLKDLEASFKGAKPNIAEENMQARIRGNLLMAISNKFSWLVISTGNKSETSTGYCTLYGDMVGGFNVLKDVPKTLVYKLVEWRNKQGQVIPESIIDRAPTAELKPDQKDQDTLPPYDVLDKVIKAYVEDNKSLKDIIKLGIDEKTAKKTLSMIERAEYKRRQSPPGPRITERAFGKDWRLPITNGYKEY